MPTTIDVPELSETSIPDSGLNYVGAMYSLLVSASRGLNIRPKSRPDYKEILDIITSIAAITQTTQPHLKSVEHCDTIRERCEHYALQLHTSFVCGWLSTRAFRRTEVPLDQDGYRSQLAATGIRCLIRSVEAYLKLCPLSLQASRTWAFIHNGLSSALVLGLLSESKTNPEVRHLQGELIQELSNGCEDSSVESTQNRTVFLSPEHERALMALKNLYNEQASRSQQAPGPQESTFSVPSPPARPQELASSTSISDVETSRSVMASGHHPGQSMDPAVVSDFSEMYPMEMFDSIIWGKPTSLKIKL